MPRIFPTLATFATLTIASHAQTPNLALMKYACGPANRMFATLSPTSRFTDTTAGFDLIASPEIAGNSCTSDQPFFFSVAIPEGNYRVTVILGGPQASVTTVRAEGRRLMLEKIPTEPNASLTRSFDTNVRYPEIAGNPANLVKLKDREQGILNWDHKLTIEFNGDHPSVRSISIEPIPNEPTIYLAGDSTVVDQDKEPWAAWGQMLPRLLPAPASPSPMKPSPARPSAASSASAASTRSSPPSSPGDYLLIQFAHNDHEGGQRLRPRANRLQDSTSADYIAGRPRPRRQLPSSSPP